MKRLQLITWAALAVLMAAGPAAAAPDQQPSNQPHDEVRDPLPSELMPLAGEVVLNGITRAGEALIAVGARGIVLRSADGKHWRQIKIPSRAMLTRVVFYNDKIGWAVGWDGVILRTTDGGKSWTLVHWAPQWGHAYFDVLPTGPDSAIVVGSRGHVLRTRDAGQTWTRLKNPVFARGYHFFDIQPIGDSGGDSGLILAGERGVIARSLDGGQTWAMLKPPYPGSYFGALPAGKWGVVLYGLEGEVYYAPDIRVLPTIDKPQKYSPFLIQQITDPKKLAAMGWIHIDNPSEQSIFGGRITENGHMLFVGVEGNVVYGQLGQNNLKLADRSPTAEALSDLVLGEKRWILTGFNGLYTMEPLDWD